MTSKHDRKRDVPLVGITLGDPNGIGPEIIVKIFSDTRLFDFCIPVVFAPARLLTFYARHFNQELKIHGIKSISDAVPDRLNALSNSDERFDVEWGVNSKEAGVQSISSFRMGVEFLKNDKIALLVTSPIHKENIQSEDFAFPGHTDYLNSELDGDALMFMVSEDLRVGLLTDHLPIKDVSQAITGKLIKTKIGAIKSSLKRDFGIINPRIAVMGINPHASDNSTIGSDENDTLIPALEELRSDGTLIFGPYPADGFFGKQMYRQFDAVLAAYHDQGLIPFKTISFGHGVNFTAGLSHVRTSPDHGTGYDIAGKGQADISSFLSAITTGLNIVASRREYDRLTENVLKTSIKKRSVR